MFRVYDDDDYLVSDTLALEDESSVGEPLLVPVMHNGRRVGPPTPLNDIRQRVAPEIARLPAELQGLEPAKPFTVHVSPVLRTLAAKLDQRDA